MQVLKEAQNLRGGEFDLGRGPDHEPTPALNHYEKDAGVHLRRRSGHIETPVHPLGLCCAFAVEFQRYWEHS